MRAFGWRMDGGGVFALFVGEEKGWGGFWEGVVGRCALHTRLRTLDNGINALHENSQLSDI